MGGIGTVRLRDEMYHWSPFLTEHSELRLMSSSFVADTGNMHLRPLKKCPDLLSLVKVDKYLQPTNWDLYTLKSGVEAASLRSDFRSQVDAPPFERVLFYIIC